MQKSLSKIKEVIMSKNKWEHWKSC